ncbi:PREDICTED: zinc finger protein 236-like [Rhagoletis zephyria]|uniref:zinc finger protein 236-like n=1 Tax=Rhagoletis zephyria TaxID=28612 RepID=UPI000811800D|nr:PREDICTED: zinc finger protein 236-like [Rhagoletis zephyria]XP_036344299.1 zinc finger protein 236-like [Rhagoletis pomonella]
MSRIAIKTENLDDEQEEIGIESRAAEEDGVGRQEQEKGTSSAELSNLVTAGKQHIEVGRNVNMATRQLQQIQPQPTSLLKMTGGGAGGGGSGAGTGAVDSNSRLVNSGHDTNSTKKPTLPKSRCGEVFVSNNARQWTFICTYCNKSTRDIGEFICHIKIKHLGGFADDGGDETDDGGEYEGNQPNFYEQDQDYLDCGSYLDVNVHTESEDYSLNGQDHSSSYRHLSTHNLTQRLPVIAAAVSKQEEVKRQADFNKKRKLNSAEDDTLDGENEYAFGTAKESAAQWRADPANFQSYANKYTLKTSTPDANMKNNAIANGSAAFDATDYTSNKDDFDAAGAYENDDEEDFDNQLLIAPTDSLDASILGATQDGSGGEMKAKRRQIRGTAYCALCNKTFQYYSLYRNHMIKHSNETPFKCPICKKGFKSKQAIRYHMNTHQKEKQFKCTVCSASYGTENHFISHIMTHESATAFPCMVCGQVLSSSKERDIHMANHKEERPFRCDYCNKLFRLRHHLSNHLKMHRKYRCDYCKEIFTSAIYLRKPYACPGCESSPDAQQDAANAASLKAARLAGSKNVNPLEIFETVIPGQQQHGDDYAQMVTDSEGDGEVDEDDDEGEDDDDDENDNEQQDSPMNEDGDENEERSLKDAEQEDADDDEDDAEDDEGEYEEGGAGGSGDRAIGQYGGGMKRYVCKYCPRSYSHPSGLNYHIRHKHC